MKKFVNPSLRVIEVENNIIATSLTIDPSQQVGSVGIRGFERFDDEF